MNIYAAGGRPLVHTMNAVREPNSASDVAALYPKLPARYVRITRGTTAPRAFVVDAQDPAILRSMIAGALGAAASGSRAFVSWTETHDGMAMRCLAEVVP